MNMQAFLSLLYQYIYTYKYDMVNPELDVKDIGTEIQGSYDFVIVGAGAAGCVVAHRLTEITDWNILLIEAGQYPSLEGQVPLHINDPNTEILFETTPQRACMSFGYCLWIRGRGMGGSTTVNAQIYLRPSKEDADRWESLIDSSWGYNSVLPYYKLSERNANYNNYYHNTTGPWHVGNWPYRSQLSQAVLLSAQYIGIPIHDLNGENPSGIMRTQVTIDNGVRESTYTGFLKPIRDRPNLHLSINSTAEQILFDGTRATGVRFRKNGIVYNVNATREVILCAGIISSPHLLLVSGIGPADQLQSLGIPVIKDLPVGENIQDHLNVPLLFHTIAPVSQTYYLTEENIRRYVHNPSSGPLTFNGIEAIARLNFTSIYPEIEVTINLINSARINTFTLQVCNIKPVSRGSIILNTSDIYDPPLINPNYLAEDVDLDITLQGLWRTYQLLSAPPLRALNATLDTVNYYQMCLDHVIPSNNFFRCIIANYSDTAYHPVGGCIMGHENQSTSVVNPRLNIIGLQNIRVVDSSAIPFVPTSNTQAPTVMLAEKGSDMIKADNGQQPIISG